MHKIGIFTLMRTNKEKNLNLRRSKWQKPKTRIFSEEYKSIQKNIKKTKESQKQNVENVFSTNNPQNLQMPFSCGFNAQKCTLLFESQMKNGPYNKSRTRKQDELQKL